MRTAQRVATLFAATALVSAPFTATARADDPGPLFFRAGGFNCSIAPDGTVGCDLSTPAYMTMRVAGVDLPMPFQVNQVVIDVPWASGHPGFAADSPYTLPGGNPGLDDVATGHDMWGPSVEYAGAKCVIGFHGSFACTSKGHSFARYATGMSAS